MPIVIPGKRFSPRLTKSKLFAGGIAGKKSVAADLLVTPLVDMFIIIVIFLLQNFSATGEILFMSKDVTLPNASNGTEVERSPVVQISAEGEDEPFVPKAILVEGEQVVQIADLARDEYWNIPALEEKLRDIKKRYEALHGGDAFKGDINIQAHHGIPFSTIKRVMFSCNQAGFTNINFAAMRVGAAAMADKPGLLAQ
ncbi:MAG: biopolymer transporter ExbD [Myxococcales bacterium]|jgi:biopolymer transport protein ExbD|nr:biopolymer transporter ExbD [Myxococcales bacterium]